MKLWAARYWDYDGSKDYEIVLYSSKREADEDPHSYMLSFSRSEWRRMKCRVPKDEEALAVELTATEIK